MFGNVVVLLGSPNNSQEITAHRAVELVQNPVYIIYLVVSAGLALIFHIWFISLEKYHGVDEESLSDEVEIVSRIGSVAPSREPTNVRSHVQLLPDKTSDEASATGQSEQSGIIPDALVGSAYIWVKIAPAIYAAESVSVQAQPE